jgi:NitT/TauT family transport system substrate-binding protein
LFIDLLYNAGGEPGRQEASPMSRPPARFAAALLVTLVTLGLGASATAAKTRDDSGTSSKPVTLRLGYFANVTHAPALVGIEGGILDRKLGKHVDLELKVFNAGTEAIEAISAGALDASYIGPSPTITAWTQFDKGVRVVSGAASGGAYLVVKPDIDSAADLKGKTLATPQLGNTQDVALRTWLKQHGLSTDTAGGGDVSIHPQDNATSLTAFKSGDIQGAWVPEPWATRLVTEGGGKILVDEATLWPRSQFVTTQLIVTSGFLKDHPDVVQQLVNAQVAANDYIKTNTADAEALVQKGIQDATGKPLAGDLVIASFKNIQFTDDPIASSLVKVNKDQKALGFPAASSLKGLYDLSFLNKALKAAGEPLVPGAKT